MHHPASTNCLNCEAVITPEQAYCSGCGQKCATHRLSFHELWHDVVHYMTHADKSIFKLFGALITRPGVVAREYVGGKRARYFKPLNYFLIVAGIVVFMTSFFSVVDDSRARGVERYASTIKEPAKQAHYRDMAGRIRQTNKFIGKYSNFIHMLATPLITVIIWLFYTRGKYSYVEHLVANMYFVSTLMVFYALVVVPFNALVHSSTLALGMLGAFFLFELIYRGWAYYQFIGKKGMRAWWKAMGVTFFTVVLWVSGTMYIISTYIRTGFR
jgi:hypothetical protein